MPSHIAISVQQTTLNISQIIQIAVTDSIRLNAYRFS